ncbi:MAG: hypothetical protein IPK81_18370 [Rhodospirillales bacterium]|nr:MAG: hypothetical protein IPK81_18370 [Rhodospirillales bacterium]
MGVREANIRPLIEALADTGECMDSTDVERQLIARGYLESDAARLLADPETRRAVNKRCVNARVRILGSMKAHPARLDPSALYRKPR